MDPESKTGPRLAAAGRQCPGVRPYPATRLRPTVAAVDLDAIRHNLRALRPPGAEVMAMVKADGYGHGDLPVAGAALEAGASWLGVALVEEGIRLRDAGVSAPILVVAEFPPGSERAALAAGLTASVFSRTGARRMADAARALRLRPAVHLQVDTGTHRLGVAPGDAAAVARRLADAGLDVSGLWTHFAMSERADDPFTRRQLACLLEVAAGLRAAGVRPRLLHAASTAAAMTMPDTHLDLVRLGVGMYGVAPSPGLPGADALRPSMSWRTMVVQARRLRAGEGVSYGLAYRLARPATVATIPVGFADGYPRVLSAAGRVLIRGRRRPVAGLITMDHLMVDCGEDPVRAGDEVVLLGRQGGDEITAGELADWAGTIADEILCSVGPRVPREYVQGQAGVVTGSSNIGPRCEDSPSAVNPDPTAGRG